MTRPGSRSNDCPTIIQGTERNIQMVETRIDKLDRKYLFPHQASQRFVSREGGAKSITRDQAPTKWSNVAALQTFLRSQRKLQYLVFSTPKPISRVLSFGLPHRISKTA